MENNQANEVSQEQEAVSSPESAPAVKDLGVEVKTPIFQKPKANISVPIEKPVMVSKTIAIQEEPLANKINQLRENGSNEVKTIILLLDQYRDAMNPRKQQTNPVEGSKKQANLYSIIMRILRKPQDEFKEYFDLYLNYFYLYKDDVFGERYVHRFQEDLTLFMTASEIDSFNRLVDLSRIYCDPSTRTKPKPQISLEKSYTGLEGDQVNNLQIYFQGR